MDTRVASLSIRLISWNLGRSNHFSKCDDLNRLLGLNEEELPDLCAIGLQDINSIATVAIEDSSIDEPFANTIESILRQRGYSRVSCLQLLHMHLSVYVKESRLVDVSKVHSAVTTVGGVKGGISIRLKVLDTNMCFINSHLLEMQDYHKVVTNLKFKHPDCSRILDDDYVRAGNLKFQLSDLLQASKEFKDPEFPKILDNDLVLWLGDFYSTLKLSSNKYVRKQIRNKQFEELLKYDQLNFDRKNGLIFQNFKEGEINFPPTSMYDEFNNRIPAWRSRILWSICKKSALSVKQYEYMSLPAFLTSDHKPLFASFVVEGFGRPYLGKSNHPNSTSRKRDFSSDDEEEQRSKRRKTEAC